MADYGTELTARLAALGVSRNALARALGHHGAGAVSRWAAGKVVPREGSRAAIEKALGEAVWYAVRRERAETAYQAVMATEIGPETPQDAPGPPILGEPDPS